MISNPSKLNVFRKTGYLININHFRSIHAGNLHRQAKPGPKWHGDAVGFFDGFIWTPPQGTVNFDDVVAAIKTFQDPNAFNATHVSLTDVHPNLTGVQINKIVNFDDVFVLVLGFQGFEYPGPQIELCRDS